MWIRLHVISRFKSNFSYSKLIIYIHTHTHIYIYVYIYIVEKSPNSSHMYDHGFMDNTNRQAVKNWLDSQTRDASHTTWRQPFCKKKKKNSCLHDVRDASLVYESSQFLTAWRLVLSMKPWSYIRLEFGLFFNNYSNHPRICVLSTLCGNVDKRSPFYIYICIFIYIYLFVTI